MMATDSRYDDLRDRVRTLESGAEGDRLVHIRLLEQQQRLTTEVSTVRGAVDALSGQSNKLTDDMSIVKATQIRHGRALDVLAQDVRQIRQDMATREDVALIHARLDQVQAHMDRRLGEMQGHTDRRLGEMQGHTDHRLGEMQGHTDHRLEQMDRRLGQMDHRLDQMQTRSDARHAELLAAIRALGSGSAHLA